MSRLEIRILGRFEAALDDVPITGFESDSARALLAYLAAHAGRPCSRAALAELLWPERPEGGALSNLRHVLSVLRRVLGETPSEAHFLQADRTTVSLALSPDLWVDLVEFERLAAASGGEAHAVDDWLAAVQLWRGPLLDHLRLNAGAEWEEWRIVTAEHVRRQYAGILRQLTDHFERAGTWDRAVPLARRLVEIDPWDERGHRQLMRLLVHTGAHGEAVAHFEELHKRLAAEFATEPAVETAALASQIRSGAASRDSRAIDVAYPSFLIEPTTPVGPGLFVGREPELSRLDACLDAALGGRGGVALIAGEAGSGKTMLAAEFLRQATERHDVVTARGRCNAYAGLGDPYLPFREVLAELSGDVEPKLVAGTINREQATRLWEGVPAVARMIAERTPSLVGVMVNGAGLLQRAEFARPGAESLDLLRTRVQATAMRPPGAERQQPALFDDYTALLAGIASIRPVVVVIDDLQWADSGSVALFWHLARRLGGTRALLVGLYRPEELDVHGASQEAIAPIISELRAAYPESVVELGADRRFIDALLDTEPNELGADFRDRLFDYTRGHALFTVELVRGMQDRAELRRDRRGIWTAQSKLDWDRLPQRVEAVVGQRIGRLAADLRTDLETAAVQGEEFIAEVVAAVRLDEDASSRLSREAGSADRLIEPIGVTRINGRLAARHRFRHVLFQRFLYDRMDHAERVRLHEATGRALEDLYREQADQPVVDLAYHFDAADLVEPAIEYLQRAGQRAVQMSANDEAIRLLRRAAAHLESLPERAERDERELALLVALAAPTMAVRGYASPEGEHIGSRVRELCDRVPPSPTVVLALIGLAQVLSIRARHRAAATASDEALSIALELGNPSLELLATFELGYCLMWAGDLNAADANLRRAMELHDPERDAWLTHVFGIEPGAEAMVWAGGCAVMRGFPDRGAELGEAGLAFGRTLGHPFTLCHVLAVETVNRLLRGDPNGAIPLIEELDKIAADEHFPYWEVGVDVYRGWAEGTLHRPDLGARRMRRGLTAWRAMGAECHLGLFACAVSDLEIEAGSTTEALETLTNARADAAATDEQLSLAYLDVARARLLAEAGHAEAERAVRTAMEGAERVGARLLELRAATELVSIVTDPRDREEARAGLESRSEWFTEGFDLPELVTARRVLDRI